ncbi:hypothetical protein BURMUCGD2M_4463 [Burkholderia multivorans CGD2M]|uniref:Uncharacterized protein n=1 Tax=Burkholderia multivorans CGD2 TaxID=513052 RepID=B9BH39_9BURK|nr:hypothetical protein BURMUCGD2_4475 [Burkholderia multivorans CGD2]EEE15021.1 hypothetical protein BURMUCGD2M_4463 [Burkholderia multivorans CGD2M]
MRVHADPAKQSFHARERHADQLSRAALGRARDDRREHRPHGPIGARRAAVGAARGEPRQLPHRGRARQRQVGRDQIGEQRFEQVRTRGRQQPRTTAQLAAAVARDDVHRVVVIERVAIDSFVRGRQRPAKLLDEDAVPIARELRRLGDRQLPSLVNEGLHGCPRMCFGMRALQRASRGGGNW